MPAYGITLATSIKKIFFVFEYTILISNTFLIQYNYSMMKCQVLNK